MREMSQAWATTRPAMSTPVSARFLEVQDGGAGDDDRGQGPDQGAGGGGRPAPRHEGGDNAGDEPGLGDDEAGDEHAGERGGGDVAPGGPRVARESGVQWLHALRIVRLGPWSQSSGLGVRAGGRQ